MVVRITIVSTMPLKIDTENGTKESEIKYQPIPVLPQNRSQLIQTGVPTGTQKHFAENSHQVEAGKNRTRDEGKGVHSLTYSDLMLRITWNRSPTWDSYSNFRRLSNPLQRKNNCSRTSRVTNSEVSLIRVDLVQCYCQ